MVDVMTDGLMPTLFDLEQTEERCRFPNHAGNTGYREGCRCRRCRNAKAQERNATRSGICHMTGCGNYRLRYRRWCQDHAPQCASPGCTNARRMASGARYCEDHASMVNGVLVDAPRLVMTACAVCGDSCKSRIGTATPLCPEHQSRRPDVKNWVKHGATGAMMAGWLADPRCWICRRSLSLRWSGSVSDSVHVDHDHHCCPGEYGCERCIRGLTHARCNTALGALEGFVARIGMDRLLEILVDINA